MRPPDGTIAARGIVGSAGAGPAVVESAMEQVAMELALGQAADARRRTSPNPWVGAVVLPPGSTDPASWPVGSTEPPGQAHAEVVALASAGDRARGATLVATLEPCCHRGRTGPCTDAIVAAGITRVVVALLDPDPNVSGRGVAELEAAGLEVVVGVGAAAAEEQLAPYLTQRRTGRPYVVLKLAATLDGRIAAPDGTASWITSEDARRDAHELRADSDAIIVGAGTVRADDPQLTVRLDGGGGARREPLRVVLGAAPAEARARPVLELSGDLGGVLDELGRRGVLQALVEGGAQVAHGFHAAGLVDRYVVYLAPALFGGDDAVPMFRGPGAATVDELWRGRLLGVRQVGSDLRVDLARQPAGSEAA